MNALICYSYIFMIQIKEYTYWWWLYFTNAGFFCNWPDFSYICKWIFKFFGSRFKNRGLGWRSKIVVNSIHFTGLRNKYNANTQVNILKLNVTVSYTELSIPLNNSQFTENKRLIWVPQQARKKSISNY